MLAIGWIGTTWALAEKQLVVPTTPVVLDVAPISKERPASVPSVQLTSLGVSDTPCAYLIEPFFYAVDLMLPVIPLHQETSASRRSLCGVSSSIPVSHGAAGGS